MLVLDFISRPSTMKSVRALRVASRGASVCERQVISSASLFTTRHGLRSVNRGSTLCLSRMRCKFSTSTQKMQEQQATFPDPERSDLWYHLYEPPTPASGTSRVFAVSLVSTPPPIPNSVSIVGWLPAEHHSGQEEAGLNDFVENGAFGG